MTRLCDQDREVIGIWQEHGMPDDLSTRQYAVRLLDKALADLDEMHDIVNQFLEREPRMFVEVGGSDG